MWGGIGEPGALCDLTGRRDVAFEGGCLQTIALAALITCAPMSPQPSKPRVSPAKGRVSSLNGASTQACEQPAHAS